MMINKHDPVQINAPLLFRLLDTEPDNTRETQTGKWVDLDTLYDRIRINLEHILNTRTSNLKWPRVYRELPQSVLAYGTPDFTHNQFGNSEAQQLLCRELKQIINRFEPRLTNVDIVILDNDVEVERTLKIRIEAAIDIAPSPVAAVFESTLDVVHHNFDFN